MAKLDEMIAAAKAQQAAVDARAAERRQIEHEARVDQIGNEAYTLLTDMLGADLFAELGVTVRVKWLDSTHRDVIGSGVFVYDDEEWRLRYIAPRAGYYSNGESAATLVIDVPGLPKERWYDKTKRGREVHVSGNYATQLLLALAAYREQKAAELAEQAREEESRRDSALKAQQMNEERERDVQARIAAAKAEDAEIRAEADAFFAEQRASMWRWPVGFELVLYRWRWYVAYSPDGGVEYDEAYALTDSLTEGGWLHTFGATARDLKLIAEAHKPVVERCVFKSAVELPYELRWQVEPKFPGVDIVEVGEYANRVRVWQRAEEGRYSGDMRRSLGFVPQKWLADFIDAQVGDCPREPLPSATEDEDEESSAPSVEDLPF